MATPAAASFPEEYAHSESVSRQESPLTPPSLTTVERDDILSLCRRLMQHNPFAALGIHWTAIPSEQKDAADSAKRALATAAEKCFGDEKLRVFIEKATREIETAFKQLRTVKQRRTIRERFVPREQLESSIELAKHQLEMANFRGQKEELPRLTQLIDELVGQIG